MLDKVFVGEKLADLDIGVSPRTITGLKLNVDSDHVYFAGDETGRVLEKTVPWGTQAMANAILAALRNVDYQPYSGIDALLDPGAEIGDGITVGGIYSVVAQKDIRFGKQTLTNITAPESDEIDDEYPYISKVQRAANRQLAQTRSLITKTAEQIRLEVMNEVEGLSSSITVTLDSIISRVDGLDGAYSEISQTVDDISLRVTNAESGLSQTVRLAPDGLTIINAQGSALTIDGGQINAESLNLTDRITFKDLSKDMQGDINNISDTADKAASNAASALSEAYSAYSAATYAEELARRIANGEFRDGTFISGTEIYSPTIYANEFSVFPEDARSSGSFNLHGYVQSSLKHMLSIWYGFGDGPEVIFDSPASAGANWSFIKTYLSGEVYLGYGSRIYGVGEIDFTNMTVKGLPSTTPTWG